MSPDLKHSKALLRAPKAPKPPAAHTLVKIAREYGVSPMRQLREMIALNRGPGKLALHEYVSTGAFDPDIAMADKKQYVGRTGSYLLNKAANNFDLTVSRGFVRDKALFTQLLHSVGIAATKTQALIHPQRGLGTIPCLKGREDVVDFLASRAVFPIFGKPVEGSGSIGSSLIQSVDASQGRLRLGNGQDVDLNAFAQELIADYPEGFILQSAIDQHSDLTRVIGTAIGTLRVVTLRDHTGIKPLYTLWKIPSPDAMSDNYWQNGSMIADVTIDGQVGHCARGTGPNYHSLQRHPVSEIQFSNVRIPFWDKVLNTACAAHAVFPEFGVIGWDIALGQDGPIVVEANDNPYHALYQTATRRGARNPTMLAKFEAAASETSRLLDARVKTFQQRKHAEQS
ncbi:MAG: sugar-transfer associated ATP-grasp domain-containing protein [Paracoccaceae bacterium]